MILPKQRKKEIVTASFHYLQREQNLDGKKLEISPFSKEEFESLCTQIKNQKLLNLSDPKQFSAVKFGQVVPFSKVNRLDERCLFGVYEGAYWGHAYKNSDKGDISAESINQRRFHFMLYLSDSGRIYVASQYLGNYGG